MSDSASIDNDKSNYQIQNEKNEEAEQMTNSPILASRYAHRSSKLIYSIEKNFYWILGIVGLLFVLSLLDFLKVHYIFPFSLDTPITILSAISVVALGYCFRIILRSKRMLESWAAVFERNSIRAAMTISMANLSKEDAVHAIAETIEEIGEPLRKYISFKGNFNEFLNVSFSKNKNDDRTVETMLFDVLIDAALVTKTDTVEISNSLIKVLNEYGAIIIKIADGTITKEIVTSFSKQVKYYSKSTKNKVHLAIIIGDDASEEAYKLAIKSETRGISYFVLVEKPTPSHLSMFH